MLEVHNLQTYHGKIRVLRELSFRLDDGELVAIIGANGAGKSTLLGTLAGIYRLQSGEINFNGKSIVRPVAEEMVRMGISLVPERRQIFESLTVTDNLLLGAYHRYNRDKGRIPKDLQEIMSLFPALPGKERHLAGTLSGGLQQMVAIARGLMAHPKVLMLDEPSVGLAPMIVKEIMGILCSLRERGTTIILVEQNARAALKVADRVYVMERGRMVLTGTAEELLKDPRVEHAYLGKGYHLEADLA
ncbi:MAG: ABC transporter ATP-binding protein [Carboxydocellales bacterium]